MVDRPVVSDAVGEKIREVRQAQRLRMADLAIRCAELGADQLSESVIGDIERGRKGPDGVRRRDISVDEMVTIATALRMSPVELLPSWSWGLMLQVTIDQLEAGAKATLQYVDLMKSRQK